VSVYEFRENRRKFRPYLSFGRIWNYIQSSTAKPYDFLKLKDVLYYVTMTPSATLFIFLRPTLKCTTASPVFWSGLSVVRISVVSVQTSRHSSAYQANTDSTFKLSTTMLFNFLSYQAIFIRCFAPSAMDQHPSTNSCSLEISNHIRNSVVCVSCTNWSGGWIIRINSWLIKPFKV
jgi:hypothetical protein